MCSPRWQAIRLPCHQGEGPVISPHTVMDKCLSVTNEWKERQATSGGATTHPFNLFQAGQGGWRTWRSRQRFHRRLVRNVRRSSPSTKLPIHRASGVGGEPGKRSTRSLNTYLQVVERSSAEPARGLPSSPKFYMGLHGLECLLKYTNPWEYQKDFGMSLLKSMQDLIVRSVLSSEAATCHVCA